MSNGTINEALGTPEQPQEGDPLEDMLNLFSDVFQPSPVGEERRETLRGALPEAQQRGVAQPSLPALGSRPETEFGRILQDDRDLVQVAADVVDFTLRAAEQFFTTPTEEMQDASKTERTLTGLMETVPQAVTGLADLFLDIGKGGAALGEATLETGIRATGGEPREGAFSVVEGIEKIQQDFLPEPTTRAGQLTRTLSELGGFVKAFTRGSNALLRAEAELSKGVRATRGERVLGLELAPALGVRVFNTAATGAALMGVLSYAGPEHSTLEGLAQLTSIPEVQRDLKEQLGIDNPQAFHNALAAAAEDPQARARWDALIGGVAFPVLEETLRLGHRGLQRFVGRGARTADDAANRAAQGLPRPQPAEPSPDFEPPRLSAPVEARTRGQAANMKAQPEPTSDNLPIGTVIGKRKLVRYTSDGRGVWQVVAGERIPAEQTSSGKEHGPGSFTDPPSEDEVFSKVVRETRSVTPPEEPQERLAARIVERAEQVARLSGIDNTAEIENISQDVRALQLSYEPTARKKVINNPRDVVEREIEELRGVFTSPSTEFGVITRKTALARAAALEDALIAQERAPGEIGQIDVDNTAMKLSGLDEAAWNEVRALYRSREGELHRRIISRAEEFRATGIAGQDVSRNHEAVRDFLDRAQLRSSRGVERGSTVISADGQPIEVVQSPQHGFVNGRTSNGEVVRIDLRESTLVPEAGSFVETSGGQIGQVQAVDFAARETTLELPDGSTVGASFNEIERVGATPFDKARMKEASEGVALDLSGTTELREPQRAVFKDTGESVLVTRQGDQEVIVVDSSGESHRVSQDAIDRGSKAPDPPEEVQAVTGVEPGRELRTFEPGTTPSAEGRHINFIQVPEEQAEFLKRALGQQTGTPADILDNLQGASYHLLPQPTREGTRLFAVELPAEARSLTSAAKRLLGAIGGKTNQARKVNPSTMTARIRPDFDGLTWDDIRLYEVPEGLRGTLPAHATINQRSTEGTIEYLRKLTDMGFQPNEMKVEEALTKAADAKAEAEQLRAEGDRGGAEVKDIEFQVERGRAARAQWEGQQAAMRKVWESVKTELTELMLDPERRFVERLNAGEADALKEQLASMPGRTGRYIESEQLTFAHPQQPGYLMVIDKETIPTTVRGQPLTVEQADEILGGIRSEEGLAGGGIEDLTPEEVVDLLTSTEVKTRDVFHLTWKTPSGEQIKFRTIGTGRPTVKVPRSLASGEAQQRLDAAAAAGRDPYQVAKEMRESERRTERIVRIQGFDAPVEIVEEGPPDGASVLRNVNTDEIFNLPTSEVQVEKVVSEDLEGLEEVPFFRRLEPGEIIEEVMADLGKFDKRARIASVGEWRSGDPGIYADIRPVQVDAAVTERTETITRRALQVEGFDEPLPLIDFGPGKAVVGPNEEVFPLKDVRKPGTKSVTISRVDVAPEGAEPELRAIEDVEFIESESTSVQRIEEFQPVEGTAWQVRVYEEPTNAASLRDKRAKVVAEYHFDSFDDAAATLTGRGFSPTRPVDSVPKMFRDLPPVDRVPARFMTEVEEDLKYILEHYDGSGMMIPKPVKDYARSFALRWENMGLPRQMSDGRNGIFTSRLRQNLNIFYGRDLSKLEPRSVEEMRNRLQDQIGDVKLDRGRAQLTLTDQPLESVVDGIVLDATHRNLRDPRVVQYAEDLFTTIEHNRRFFDMDPEGPPDPYLMTQDRLVRFGPNDRVGVVLDPKLGKAEDALVQVVEAGELKEITVPKSQITRVRDPEAAHDFRMNVLNARGEVHHLPKTKDMGAGVIDEVFGLSGITESSTATVGGEELTGRTLFKRRFSERLDEILDRIQVAEDGTLTHDPDDVDLLVDAYIRMKELDLGFENKFEGPLEFIEYEAFQRIANRYGTSSPIGDLMAKAKLGRLTDQQLEAIRKQAKFLSLPLDTPPWQVLEASLEMMDPITANRLYQLRNDLGFIRAFRGAEDLPDLAFEVREPATGLTGSTNIMNQYFSMPRTIAENHPTLEMFQTMAEKRRTWHGRILAEMVNRVKSLEAAASGLNFNLERRQQVWDIMVDERLADVMDHPMDVPTTEQIKRAIPEVRRLDWDWETPFREYRRIGREMLRLEKENALQRGYFPEKLDSPESLEPAAINEWAQRMKKEYNLTEEEFKVAWERAQNQEPFFYLHRVTNPAKGKPRSEIRDFLELQEQYGSLKDMPEGLLESLPEWMREDFDFWKNWGLKNYGARVFQGKHVIFRVLDDGTEVPVGAAPSGGQAYEMLHREIKKGTFPRDAEFRMELRGAYVDDLDLQYVGRKRFAKLYAQLASHIDEVNGSTRYINDMLNKVGIEPGPRPPKGLHLEPRRTDMKDMIEDPARRLMIYVSRVTRNKFLLDMMDDYERALALDADLSRGFGVKPAKEIEPALKFMQQLRDDYAGKQSDIEKMMDYVVHVLETPIRPPKSVRKTIGSIKERLSDDNYSLMSDPNYLSMMYSKDFASRKWAETSVAWQSVLRLGLNLGGAAVNSTQYFMYGMPELIRRGASVGEAARYTEEAYRDLLDYTKHVVPERVSLSYKNKELAGLDNPLSAASSRGEELFWIADALGISSMPAKGTQGPGMGLVGGAQPLTFSDDGPLEKLTRWTEWVAMWPFSKSERVVRLPAGFAAFRMARDKGMDFDAAINFAKSVIDDTMFQYYDAALPKIMRGPAGRVAFQFKPFVTNALKWSKDVFFQSLPGGAPFESAGKFKGSEFVVGPSGNPKSAASQGRKAAMMHAIAGMLLGGGVFFAGHILFWPLAWLFSQVAGIDRPEDALIVQSGRSDYKASPGADVGNVDFFNVRNMFLFGGPGALGYNIATRLAVGGQDIDPRRMADLIGGPTFSMYSQTFSTLSSFVQQQSAPKGRTFLGLGAAEIARRLGGFRGPVAQILFGLGGVSAATTGSDNPLTDYLQGTEQGMKLVREIAPPIAVGANFTYDLFEDNIVYDSNFQKRKIGHGPTRLHEAAGAIFNLEPTRSAKERAYLDHIYRKSTSYDLAKRAATQQAALLFAEGDYEGVMKHLERARRNGIDLDLRDIERAFARMELGPVEKRLQQVPTTLRQDILTELEGGPPEEVERP